MTEPTEDEVLAKAKQLAHDDGRLWDIEDIQDAPAARDRLADDSLRAEYLNRARDLLRQRRSERRSTATQAVDASAVF
jgi:hypothetical protein